MLDRDAVPAVADPLLVDWPVYRNNLVDFLRNARRRTVISGMWEADVTETLRRLQAVQRRAGVGLSFNAYLVYLLARAVRKHPEVQAVRVPFRRKTAQFGGVDVGTAVEQRLPGRGSLPLPYTVRDADRKSLAEICIEMRRASKANLLETDEGIRWRARLAHYPAAVRRLIWRWVDLDPARRRRVRGTVGLTNLNALTVRDAPVFVHSTTLLTTTLCVGSLYERLIPCDVDPRGFRRSKRLCLTLHCDHLLVDGAPMTRFARTFHASLEAGDGLDDDLADDLVEALASRHRSPASV